MFILPPIKKQLWPWLVWLMGFYVCWAVLVFAFSQWTTVIEHWPIATAMALGSYTAGSTPMGGGTVAFPVLVLLLDMPATLGRDFSFAVQAIGMTSASILILCRRQPLARAMLKGALLGSLVGTPLGIFLLAPLLPEFWIKSIFAVIWASFGVLHLYRLREITSHQGITELNKNWDFKVGLVLGALAGATMVAVTGVGIDMVIYSALVLLCRADLKIAIPTSVVLMAFNSLLGIAIKIATDDIEPGVYQHWLAAAPIVAVGAPLGAVVVSLVDRRHTLLFVAILCVGQYLWACRNLYAELGYQGIIASIFAVILGLIILEALRAWGGHLVEKRQLT